MNIKNKEKTIVYSTDESYIECLCEVKDDSIKKFRTLIKEEKISCELLHIFENILKEDVINLEKIVRAITDGEDIEKTANITKQFLDMFNIKDSITTPLEEFSSKFRHSQKGTFGTNKESNKTLRKYESLYYNNTVMKSIGYELKAQSNNTKNTRHRKILAIAN